ncbi:MAG: ABC transporter ATP-binding protein [Flavipsychrobacter sp.]|nr:ABC transporter ATP-binding protein [Flavipsychrobacter sp.]
MVDVEHVTQRFGNTVAVDDISFTVAEGENLVLLGTSGCGKTTTLKMINKLITPTVGCVKVNGKDIAGQPAIQLRRGIGYVLQHNSLFLHYTVAENIATIPGLLKWSKDDIDNRVTELLVKLHLDPEKYRNSYPAQLSGGQQQRVNIARALAAQPPLLLMDEPFGALDTVTRTAIRKEFKELDEFKKKTIIMVTHDVQEAFELGDRICLMDKGKIVQIGTVRDLLNKPANDFVRSFLDDQRLQLTFQTIKLAELWPFVESSGQEGAMLKIRLEDTLWMAMQLLDGAEEKNAMLALTDQGVVKNVTWGILMQAYNIYKQK